MILTGMTAYLFFPMAILTGASPQSIAAAAAFYLTGAMAGLINRLSDEAGIKAAVEDYGLSTARLLAAPLISGVAAIGGVVLVAVLPVASSALNVLTPQAATTQPAEQSIPHLNDIFCLRMNVAGLVLAAVFGLTPNLLLNRLKKEAEKHVADLG
jgi:hypothetical protein